MDDHLRGDGADGQSNKLVTIEFICRKSTMQDQSRILVMVILLLLDYAQGKVGKEVFISDGGSCRRRSRVMVASRSSRSWMTEGTRGRSSCMIMLRRQWGKIIKL